MPRYQRAADILRLALDMQASADGLTLDDIRERFGVDRRTATRMRNAVAALFPGTDFLRDDHGKKHWRIPGCVPRSLVQFDAQELAALEAARKLAERDGRPDQLAALTDVARKVAALQSAATAARVDPDLEALTVAEGVTVRAGPRPAIDATHVERLREAILARRRILLRHTHRDGEPMEHKLYPYGFLQGNHHYLVARRRRAGTQFLYRLDAIEEVVLLDEHFVYDPEFSIQEFAARDSDLLPEEPMDAVWKFDAEAAMDARQLQFHPSQVTEALDDGGLIVRFRAGKTLEMCGHLLRWGKHVIVLQPDWLRTLQDALWLL